MFTRSLELFWHFLRGGGMRLFYAIQILRKSPQKQRQHGHIVTAVRKQFVKVTFDGADLAA
jgi:hypothetical protein